MNTVLVDMHISMPPISSIRFMNELSSATEILQLLTKFFDVSIAKNDISSEENVLINLNECLTRRINVAQKIGSVDLSLR